jgi:hypothetical protein
MTPFDIALWCAAGAVAVLILAGFMRARLDAQMQGLVGQVVAERKRERRRKAREAAAKEAA